MKVKKGKNYYLVSWKGHGIDDNSWIEECQIPDQQLIQEYQKRIRKGKHPTNDDETKYYVRHKYQPFTIDIPSRKF